MSYTFALLVSDYKESKKGKRLLKLTEGLVISGMMEYISKLIIIVPHQNRNKKVLTQIN